ncbi:high-affinity branched-chain amino acid ABC transporter permease LivM [Mangrovitalea sediminis]|uniref:high-affinity branched-chain amino acid ABC transporter permease LivM n=1 Tax=Mangrovitalea sediminis TaxID=1982043 RepID=UPI000BE57B27|nr:high-affinity branched-chain amino acid ABC transporter permease LivM [Mangrovitalea sediminis]
MLAKRLPFAALCAVLTLVMGLPILGLNLTPQGIHIVLKSAPSATFMWIALGAAVVFLFQLFKDYLSGFWRQVPLPKASSFTPNLEGRKRIYAERAGWFLVAVLAFAMPFFASRGATALGNLVLIYVILGLGLNIVVGLAGLLDLGYVAFYAVGAYSYALLHQYFGFGFWEALPISAILAATFGFVLGFPVLRLRGDYLAIVTLGFGEIIRIVINNMTWLTGGPNGIGGIPNPTLFNMEFGRIVKDPGDTLFYKVLGIEYNSNHKVIFLYLITLVFALFTVFVIKRLTKMPVGRAWEALREDEIACRSLGLSRTGIKLSAFTLGAFFAGFAGCVFAAKQSFISPDSFNLYESVIVLVIVVLGGMGSQVGIILAAAILTMLPELARDMAQYRMLFFGLLMVLMMIWRPQGLIPMKRTPVELARE